MLVRPFVSPLHLSVYVPVVSVCSFIRCFSVCCCCACVCVSPPLRRSARTVAVVRFLCGAYSKEPTPRRAARSRVADGPPAVFALAAKAGGSARACRLRVAPAPRPLSVPPRPRPSPLFACIAGSCSPSVCARLSLFMCPSPLSRSPVLNPQRSSAVPPCPATRSGVCLVDRKRLRLLATPRACLFCLIVSRPRCALISSAYTYSPRAAVHRSVHRAAVAAGPTTYIAALCIRLPPPHLHHLRFTEKFQCPCCLR